jgi:nucleoside-diphosphate-sugar epimerase
MYTLERLDNKKALVTGGLGFIGSNIVQKLVELGSKVTVYDACLDPYGWNFANIKEIKDKVEFIKGDIRDINLLKQVVKGKTCIFDCASQISHLISVKDPFLDIDINCKGAMTVLEAVRQENKEAKLVYAGTRGEIGKMEYNPIDEKHPTNPTDMNGIDKLAAEKYHMLYNKLYDIRTTSIRINNTYGDRGQMKNDDYGVVNWIIRRAILNEEIVIHGEGLQTRDYNYVKDVVDAIILASQSEKSNGEIFMLGSGKETRFIDVIKLILKTTGCSQEVKKIPRPGERNAIEIGNFVVSIEKIRNVLGWQPKTSLEEGIEKTILFYKERIKEYIQ